MPAKRFLKIYHIRHFQFQLWVLGISIIVLFLVSPSSSVWKKNDNPYYEASAIVTTDQSTVEDIQSGCEKHNPKEQNGISKICR